jgi:probable rRNA maturation factor
MTLKIVKLKNVNLPKLPFRKAAKLVLGDTYKLDVIFASDKFMKNLNKTYRKKDKSTNILSFALSSKEGEIVFDTDLVKKEAKKTELSFKEYLWRLFLHGILHLKGHRHERNLTAAKKMSRAESKLLKVFPV